MSQQKQDQVTAIYLLVLATFGTGMVLFALWVFCVLSGPEIGICMPETGTPF